MGFFMRNLIWLFAFVLTACGGGSSSTEQSSVTYFQEVASALTTPTPFSISGISAADAIDINGDGKDDFVVHIQSKPTVLGLTDTTPCRNQLKFFIQQPNGTFSDQTSTYLIGAPDLGGCSTVSKVADINGDGKKDIVYAVSQEDGRSQANWHDMDAQMAAVVSVGSNYIVQKFGPMNWYMSVGTLTDSHGNVLVTGYGTTRHDQPYAYKFNADGNYTQSPMQLPTISFNGFQFSSTIGGESNVLVQASENFSFDAYIKNGTTWSQLPSLSTGTMVGTVNGTDYTGAPFTNQPVYNVNGKNITFAENGKSCNLKMSPSSNNATTIFLVTGGVVPNFVSGMSVNQTSLAFYSTFVAVSVVNGQLTQIPINVNSTSVNTSNIVCKDVNNDGYDDIVVTAMTSNGMPYIYLNDHNNNFTRVDPSVFPVNQNTCCSLFSGLINDFDHDSKPDLMIYPVDYSTSVSSSYKFLKGLNFLK